LNYALGIAAATLTLMLVSFIISCANLCKRSPRNKNEEDDEKEDLQNSTKKYDSPTAIAESKTNETTEAISSSSQIAGDQRNRTEPETAGSTHSTNSSGLSPIAEVDEDEDSSTPTPPKENDTTVQAADSSSSQTVNLKPEEDLVNHVFMKNEDEKFENISIAAISYFLVILVSGQIPEMVACSNQFGEYLELKKTLDEVKVNENLKGLFKNIDKSIKYFCKSKQDEEKRDSAKKIINELESEAKKVEKKYILAGFALAYNPVFLKKTEKGFPVDHSEENKNTREVATYLISKIKEKKNSDTLVLQWNDEHTDNEIATDSSENENLFNKNNNLIEQIEAKINT
ncbi:MAG: hypothetical protein MHPSP_001121, partial [Paramarteilia canceri]